MPATVACPAGICELGQLTATAEIGGETFQLRIKAPHRIKSPKPASIQLILPRQGRNALAKHRKGVTTLEVNPTSSGGGSVVRTVRSRIFQ